LIKTRIQKNNLTIKHCDKIKVKTISVKSSNNLTKDKFMELLKLATTNQLFQLDGILYEQVEGVAMGSPLGPLHLHMLHRVKMSREKRVPLLL